MKIGIVLARTPSYSETFFNSKIKGLKAHGHEVVLFVQEAETGFQLCKVVKAKAIPKNKIKRLFAIIIIAFGLLPNFSKVINFLKLEKQSGKLMAKRLKNVLTNAHILKHKLDWLHFGFTTLAIESENIAQTIGAKMALSCRGYDMDVYPLKHKNVYDLVWKKVNKVHAISKYMLSMARKNGMKPQTPFAIITPAISSQLLEHNVSKTVELQQPIQITTIARLHWIKGLDYTLEALAMLKEKGVSFQYNIIGSGAAFEPLRFAVHQLKLEDCVVFSGQLSHESTISQLKKTHMYLQYSISEGFCNAVLEAQALGCLCIVSDGGALLENVVDNETGWVVPKRTPKLLAKKLEAVIQLPKSNHDKIRSNARQRIANLFTLEQQALAFEEFYKV